MTFIIRGYILPYNQADNHLYASRQEIVTLIQTSIRKKMFAINIYR